MASWVFDKMHLPESSIAFIFISHLLLESDPLFKLKKILNLNNLGNLD